MLTQKQAMRADRIQRLQLLIVLANDEEAKSGYRGGMQARTNRAAHVVEWQRELQRLQKESDRWLDSGPAT